MQKTLSGIVVSTKMDKTVVVRVERKFRHPLYKKVLKSHKKYMVHCEDEKVKDGDMVTIQSTRPISKGKAFILVTKEETKS